MPELPSTPAIEKAIEDSTTLKIPDQIRDIYRQTAVLQEKLNLLEIRLSGNELQMKGIKEDTQEIVVAVRNIKNGAQILWFLGYALKYVAGIIAAIVTIWVFYNYAKYGTIPSSPINNHH